VNLQNLTEKTIGRNDLERKKWQKRRGEGTEVEVSARKDAVSLASDRNFYW